MRAWCRSSSWPAASSTRYTSWKKWCMRSTSSSRTFTSSLHPSMGHENWTNETSVSWNRFVVEPTWTKSSYFGRLTMRELPPDLAPCQVGVASTAWWEFGVWFPTVFLATRLARGGMRSRRRANRVFRTPSPDPPRYRGAASTDACSASSQSFSNALEPLKRAERSALRSSSRRLG